MKKPTIKEQLSQSNGIISNILSDVLNDIGAEKANQFCSDFLQNRLYDLDQDIEDEKNFAKENPPGSTYGSAGSGARARVKHLKQVRVEILKQIKMWDLFVKQQKKIVKMWY